MSNNKKTAVEWILQYLKNVKPNEFCSIEKIKELLEQAKAMEKQQIIDAWQHGFDWGMVEQSLAEQGMESTLIDTKQYYNETYGKAN